MKTLECLLMIGVACVKTVSLHIYCVMYKQN